MKSTHTMNHLKGTLTLINNRLMIIRIDDVIHYRPLSRTMVDVHRLPTGHVKVVFLFAGFDDNISLSFFEDDYESILKMIENKIFVQ